METVTGPFFGSYNNACLECWVRECPLTVLDSYTEFVTLYFCDKLIVVHQEFWEGTALTSIRFATQPTLLVSTL